MSNLNPSDDAMKKRINNMFSDQDLPSYASLSEIAAMKARILELEEKLAQQSAADSSREPQPAQRESNLGKNQPERPSSGKEPSKNGFLALLRAPTFADATKNRVSNLQNLILLGLLGSTAIALFTLIASWNNTTSLGGLAILTFEILILVFALYLQRKGHLQIVSWLIVGVIYVVFLISMFVGTGFGLPAVAELALVIALAGLLLRPGQVVIVSLLAVASVYIGPQIGVQSDLSGSQLTFPAIILALEGLLLVLASRTLEQTFAEIDQSTKSLAYTNKELQDLTQNLEQRVTERIHDLELATEVGRTITARVNDPYRLLLESVELIRTRFNLYYTQVYLTDPSNQMIVLRAGTGEAGRQLLLRGHRLPISKDSLNGRAALEKHTIIVSETLKDEAFLPNPLLPNTRSEMAIPLLVGDRIVGVLDMQSEIPNALNESNLPAFEALAGQLAIAIQNSLLFEEAAASRRELEERSKRQSFNDWKEFLNSVDRGEKIGFAYKQDQIQPIAESAIDEHLIEVPVAIFGAEIGKLQLADDPNHTWTDSEKQLIQETADQLARHLDNLRLLAEADKYRNEAEEAVQRLTREGWEQYLQTRQLIQDGFVYDQNMVQPLAESANGDLSVAFKQSIRVRDENIGELDIAEPSTMSQEEAERLIQQVAENLSAHIENLRLSEQTQAALLATEKLYDASRTIIATQTEQEALDQLVHKLDRTGLDRIVAALKVSDDPMTAEVVAAWDRDGLEARSLGNRFTDQQLPLVSEIKPGTAVVFPDFDAPNINPLTQKVFKMQGVHSAAIVAISSGEEVVGWLLLETTHSKRNFDQASIQQYLAFAEQVSTVIQRQRLFAYTEAQRQEIQKNEARLAEALQIARLGNWEYDFEKDIFTFNDNFYAVFRTDVETVGSYQMSSAEYSERFVHPEDAPLVGTEIGKALATTEQHFEAQVEHRIFFPDGSLGYIFVSINVERDENGKIVRWYGANQDITERKQAELAIRESESRYQQILDAITDMVLVKGEKSRIVWANKSFRDYYGMTNEQLRDMIDAPIVEPDYTQQYIRDDAHVFNTGKVLSIPEEPVTRYDGVVRLFETVKAPIRDINDKIILTIGVSRDITERKRAEEILRTNEARLAEALKIARLGNFEYDVEKDIFTFNDQFYSIFHTTVEEVGSYQLSSSQYAEKFVHPEDLPMVGEAIGKALSSTERHYHTSLEHRIRYADGGTGYILVNVNVERDENGKIIRYYGANQDITERKQAENLIAERANQLETVATVSTTSSTMLNPDALLQTVVDLTKERFNLYHTHIYLADDSWNTLMLSAGASEVGRQMVTAGHSIQMDAQRSLVARAYREREAVIVNDIHDDIGFLPNPLLPHTHAEMAVPMIVGDKVLGVFDVQSEKAGYFTTEDALIYNTLASQVAVALQNARLYQEQAATLTQLRELDRLKSSFLANMSHELRTPLNSILGFTDVMLEGLDGALTPYMQNDLSLIQKNGQHLLHLINDVLDMAKIESGKLNLIIEKFSLQEIFEEVVSITSPLASEKSLSLFVEEDSDHSVEINADRTRLRQVLLNLVNNAVKFTDTGRISIRAILESNNVLISVKDTGVGIPATHLESVFQEFTQVDSSTTRKAGGTGLGLPISRRLIEMHGGRLWAESTGVEGEGSTFYVFLPIEAKVAEPEITSKS